MSDEIPPAPPVLPAPTAPALPAEPSRKRLIWPFVLVGAFVLVLLIGIAAAIIVPVVLGALSGSPSATVREFDKAFAQADCDLFKKTTTQEFQDAFFGTTLDCEAWKTNAEALRVDGKYAYTIEVHETTVSGDSAQVTTTEVDSSKEDETTYELEYQLVKSEGSWLIASITAAE
jgi:hypothetical protein